MQFPESVRPETGAGDDEFPLRVEPCPQRGRVATPDCRIRAGVEAALPCTVGERGSNEAERRPRPVETTTGQRYSTETTTYRRLPRRTRDVSVGAPEPEAGLHDWKRLPVRTEDTSRPICGDVVVNALPNGRNSRQAKDGREGSDPDVQ